MIGMKSHSFKEHSTSGFKATIINYYYAGKPVRWSKFDGAGGEAVCVKAMQWGHRAPQWVMCLSESDLQRGTVYDRFIAMRDLAHIETGSSDLNVEA